MQALYTHLECPFTQGSPRGFPVQGLNALFQVESSFGQLLKQTAVSQDLEAKEGAFCGKGLDSLHSDIRAYEKKDAAQNTAEKTDISSKGQNGENTAMQASSAGAEESSAAKEERLPVTDEDKQSVSCDGKKAAGDEGSEKSGSVSVLPENLADKAADTEDQNPLLAAEGAHSFSGQKLLKNEEKETAFREFDSDVGEKNAEQLAFSASLYRSDKVSALKTKHKAVQDTESARNIAACQDVQDGKRFEKDMYLAEIPTVLVRDERTKSVPAESDKKQGFGTSIRYDGKGSAQADLFLTSAEASKEGINSALVTKDSSGFLQAAEVPQSRFSSMLSSQIRTNAAELVKAGSIILRDGNKGTINLILHPEQLGNVKIRLQISDNILTGRITVASEEAYNAFKSNIAALTEAFASNGFDTAGFDLSWSGHRDADGSKNGQKQNPFAFRYEEQTTLTDEEPTGSSSSAFDSRSCVNLIA